MREQIATALSGLTGIASANRSHWNNNSVHDNPKSLLARAAPKEQNPDGEAGAKSKTWLLPCVLEQYRCYAPVNASSAKLIRMYLAAYRVTGDRLHLEKAKALAATLTRTQSNRKAPGRYQTWVMQNPGPMWFNCELYVVQAMQELAAVDAAAKP